jgi:hypothetical protein
VILFHALGGGLGHLTRTLAILRAAPALARRARVLASSDLAPLAAPAFPCPVDRVEGGRFPTREALADWLDGHVARHRFRAVVLDTFPWGLVGEWAGAAPGLPRWLVARDLRWDRYVARLGTPRAPLPPRACALEPLDPVYEERLAAAGPLARVEAPVLLPEAREAASVAVRRGWLVLHSGAAAEREALVGLARERMAAAGEPVAPLDVVDPASHPYPAERLLAGYRHVVTGAGYNLAAVAACAPAGRTHHLLPFERRYDDQGRRAARVAEGRWRPGDRDGAEQVAAWLASGLAPLLDPPGPRLEPRA